MKVLVTGGTGFLGTFLTGLLAVRDARVSIATRNRANLRTARSGIDYVDWLPDLSRYDAIVHLAGESIASGRWTEERKRAIRESRVETTRRIVAALGATEKRPPVLVSGSAVGYYGARGDEPLDEGSGPGADFLADVCKAWEAEAEKATAHGVRVVLLRTGLVLGTSGGALPKMLKPFKLGVGGKLGSGEQVMSWIHVRDHARMVLHAIDTAAVTGPLNATAPSPVTNAEFTRTLGRVLGRPTVLPAPGFAVKLALGEMSTLLLEGQRVLPEKALDTGFTFEYPDLEGALRHILHR